MSSSGESFLPSRRAFFSSALAVFLSVFSLPFPAFFVFFPILFAGMEAESDYKGSSPSSSSSSSTVCAQQGERGFYLLGPFAFYQGGNLEAHLLTCHH
ncbi:hypothetical protein F2Q70_00009083 [Brassica cretica]|uniref:Transmembrane protein n=1 Tax=Brassica cretica TaxID=69181 RepID=A0A8S9LWI0_BRACR|nr:hypothetical protein F2Q70_00009083 [Brassica cretica]